jgi:large repetitive protein
MLRRTSLLALTLLAVSGCECERGEDPDAGLRDGDIVLPDGRIIRVDGGPDEDGGVRPGPTVTICPGDVLPSLPDGSTCSATAGSRSLLITADVLTPGEVFRGGQVLVDATGSISCVGCDCSSAEGAADATAIVCPDGVLSPGLINAHEHVTFQADPYVGTAERYEHRHDWRVSARIDRHDHNDIPNGDDINTASWDELREVMSGTTSMNGSGSAAGLVRNLDVASQQEGLGHAAVDYDTFPLGSGGTLLESGCDYPSAPNAGDVAREEAYTPHIAEGIDAQARNEFTCMRDGATDVIEPNVAIIHGIGLLAPDIAEMAAEQTTLIWSPRSNIALYGDTARVTLYDTLGVLVALGTDWQRSGSMNMLRELTCADELNETYLDRHFTDEDLWLMATRNGAVATGTEDVIGTIAVDRVADLAIFDARRHRDHRAVIDAEPQEVALVLRAGRALYGETNVVSAIEDGCETLDVCGSQRAACIMDELDITLAQLQADNPLPEAYELFFCDGVRPDDEPSCVPQRDAMAPLPSPEVDGSNRYTGMITAADGDGDGIDDATDICPAVFDPIRPVDMGAQADFDMDGEGDSCDPCPLDADTTVCTGIDPNDRDGDSVPDTADNCPGIANTDQADRDTDGTGDLCDACPDYANPGGMACLTTIYAVKGGTFEDAARVRLEGSVVTAVFGFGLTMQVPVGHEAYVDENDSGIFVYTGTAPALADETAIVRGMTVDVVGEVNDFFRQTQIQNATHTMSTSAGAFPDAVIATAAELDTGGARAEDLEAVLVRIEDVSVTDVAPPETRTGVGAEGEFEVASSLRVDDLLFLIEPFVMAGETFDAITGVILLRDNRHKLMPRDADDYLAGAPGLATFEPALSFVRDDAPSGPTFPTALTVRLTRAAGSATPISVTSSDPSLVVSDVTVEEGSSSAVINVAGSVPGTYTLTAMLEGDSLTADVRVLAEGDAPADFTITPSPAMVRAGATIRFTVTLDIPAPPGGSMINLVDSTGGTIAPSITIPADTQVATFDFTAPDAETTGLLTATLVGSGFSAEVPLTILPALPDALLINEIDYDQASTDTTEFVELYNPGSRAIALGTLQLIFIDGSDGDILRTVNLSDAGAEIPAGGYLVVRASTVVVPEGTLTINFSAASNNIQNGPDGVLVWDSASETVLDAFAYEGDVTTEELGMRSINLIEGTRASESDSGSRAGTLSRLPNGIDTNAADDDWAFTTCVTPGAENTTTCP